MPVVDASIVVDWVAPGADPDSPAVRVLARLARSTDRVLAPRLLLEETTNALVTGIRRGRWSGAQADAAFLLLRSLPVALVDEPQDLDRAYELSRRYDEHPVYDLVYVAVAERLGEQLVTADAALRRRLAAMQFIVGPT
jgi:predicted nucleic acid-binding protein